MTDFLTHEFQLKDFVTGRAIMDAGGKILVCEAGSYALATLYNPDANYAALAQPVAASRGHFRFAVANTVNAVDVYGVTPGGQAFRQYNMKASALPEIGIDLGRADQLLVIPFDAASQGAAEVDSGFDEIAGAQFLPDPFIHVGAVDATETIDVGTATADSGDPNGFIAALSVATLGLAAPTDASGSSTLGALFKVTDQSGSAHRQPHLGVQDTLKSIVFDLSAGSDTAAGLICLPYKLINAPA